jgi:hypothetical protein
LHGFYIEIDCDIGTSIQGLKRGFVFVEEHKLQVGFEVLTAANMKIAVFWVVAPRSLVEVYLYEDGCLLGCSAL